MSYVTAENLQLALAAFGIFTNAENPGKLLYWSGVILLTLGLKLMKG